MSQNEPWHCLSTEAILNKLATTAYGLSESAAKTRLDSFGPNRLPEAPPVTVTQLFFRQFYSPLIYILIVAAVFSLVIGEEKDAAFIAAVLLLNAAIGTYQEWKAERSSQALKSMLQIKALVRRDQRIREVSAEEVVPGDVLYLESGNRVPADLRLLSANNLEIDESLLTGESLSVRKNADWLGDASVPLGDRENMAFAGSIVTKGRSKGVVVATALETQVGKLAKAIQSAPSNPPPLIQRMNRFSKAIAVITIIAAILIGILGAFLSHYTASEMFLFVVALSVAVIPEGLPVAMTVALAVATSKMAKRGVIVRRLTAVEGLGSCTLIATDKTGTLTVNELTIKEIRLASQEKYLVTGEGFAPQGEIQPEGEGDEKELLSLIKAGVLCNEGDLYHTREGWRWRGDAVDIALLSLGVKGGLLKSELSKGAGKVDEIPFESENQYSATVHREGGHRVIYAKGAPEKILEMCGLDSDVYEQTTTEMAALGYKVLALASGPCSENWQGESPENMTFLGFVGMIDPLRPGVQEAIRKCHLSGIHVAMVTGDHKVTALAIAKELGLAKEQSQVVTGIDLAHYSSKDYERALDKGRVFARVTPTQKLQLVSAAIAKGHFVAVTGDGANDAPAMRQANIGVAMGKSGTDVAREASELVLSDDDFSSIVSGIEEGRIAYDNIRKVIYFLISTGAAELVLMALAFGAGLPLPLLPVQILWLNLVTSGIQDVALAFEPGEKNIMARAPRSPKEAIFNRLMIERTIVGALVMGTVGFLAFQWMLAQGWSEGASRNVLLLLMVVFENFHLGNCRSETQSCLKLSPFRSPVLLSGALMALALHIGVMHVPITQKVLDVEPVSLEVMAVIALLAFLIVPAMELHKLWWRFWQKKSDSFGLVLSSKS